MCPTAGDGVLHGGAVGPAACTPVWQHRCLVCPTAPLLLRSRHRRDPVDLVRFGAIEAMTGVTASAAAPLTSSGAKASSGAAAAREDVVQRQRRGRAWRLLVAQSGMQVGRRGQGWCGRDREAQERSQLRPASCCWSCILALHAAQHRCCCSHRCRCRRWSCCSCAAPAAAAVAQLYRLQPLQWAGTVARVPL